MKKYFKILNLCIIFIVCFISLCITINYFKKSKFEVSEYTEHIKGKYYLKTNDESVIVPELTLFDDGRQFMFIQDESSNISLVDGKIGIYSIDGSAFVLR